MSNEAHLRIDDGIKRGPRTHQKATRRSPKADLGSWVIPTDLNPHEVIQRFLSESTTSHIAAQYGLSRKALVRWLREKTPIEWKQAQVVRALCRKDDGEEGIDAAHDALSLARAREQLRAAQWELERLDSSNYGPKQEITHTIQPVLIINTSPLPVSLPQQIEDAALLPSVLPVADSDERT